MNEGQNPTPDPAPKSEGWLPGEHRYTLTIGAAGAMLALLLGLTQTTTTTAAVRIAAIACAVGIPLGVWAFLLDHSERAGRSKLPRETSMVLLVATDVALAVATAATLWHVWTPAGIVFSIVAGVMFLAGPIFDLF